MEDGGRVAENPLSPAAAPQRPLRARIILALVGVMCVAAIITAIVNFGEVNAFARQAANAEPMWLLLAFSVQMATFLCGAVVWRIVLGQLDAPVAVASLFPLSIAKLFADQALPSAGLSGAAFILHALRRRSVPWDAAFIAFVFGSATFIAAFLISSVVALIVLAQLDAAPEFLRKGVLGLSAFLGGIAALAAVVSLIYTIRGGRAAESGLLARSRSFIRAAALAVAGRRALFAGLVGLQLFARLLDAVVLWFAGLAIGVDTGLQAAFIAISVASLAATLAPLPLGLGPFEGGLIGVLTVYGAPVEAALTASVLFRGLSLWLPLAIGFVVVQRELLEKPAPLPQARRKMEI